MTNLGAQLIRALTCGAWNDAKLLFIPFYRTKIVVK